MSYSQAQVVTGDIIVEQAMNSFDEVGNTVSVASYRSRREGYNASA